MHDILTVTLNPALDLATSVSEVQPNIKLRCAPPVTDPGGGGINVARAIHQLDGQARCFVALGGDTGHALLHLLTKAGLTPVVHTAPSETRKCLAVIDLHSNNQFRFMLPSPDWEPDDIDAARAAIRAAAQPGSIIVLSGSGPSGGAPDLYARICQDFADTDARVILDTSGPILAHLAAGQVQPPMVLRMDQHEAEGLARRPLSSRDDSAAFAASLVRRGAGQMVIVARGADGSVLADGTQRLHVAAPKVEIRSKVGAGDSFVGGFTMALARDEDIAAALQHGSAAASAAVMTDGTQLCHKDDYLRLLDTCVVNPL